MVICPPRVWPTPGCAYVAREQLQIGGRTYKPGDPFDYTAHGMIELQAEQWWLAAKLDVAPVIAATASAPAPAAKAPLSAGKHRR